MKPATALRKHTLLVGFAAVLLPLVILLALQYRWLVELDHTSAKAQEATSDNYLEAVADKVESRYRNDAERLLNVPPNLFTENGLEDAAYYFKKKGVTGAKRLFVVSFVNDHPGTVYYFEPSCSSFSPPLWSPEVQAVYVAVSPFALLAHKGGVLAEPVEVLVDQRDPGSRMILNPITDESSHPIGVAGMILDESWFRNEV